MSRTNRNFVFAYTFLVILPLVGLAGILKSGRNLVAPVSIDGVWSLQENTVQLNSQACGKAFAALPGHAFTISQSGRSFVLSFPSEPSVTASGTLDGTTLRGSVIALHASSSENRSENRSENGSENSCGRELSLQATVSRDAESTWLAGTLSAVNCATCPAVEFRAQRQAPAAARGGH
jgi:hypothetical protein